MEDFKIGSKAKHPVASKFRAVTLLLNGHGVEFAIRKTGLSRSTVYRALRKFREKGLSGLEVRSRLVQVTNAFSESTVNEVLELTRRFPTYSYPRIAEMLRERGLRISNSGVQKIWRRNGLTNRLSRLCWTGRTPSIITAE